MEPEPLKPTNARQKPSKREEWRPVERYPHVEVSDLGRVRVGRRRLRLCLPGKHLLVRLPRPDDRKVRVDRLVVDAFLGARRGEKGRPFTYILHRDRDPENCRLSNLLQIPRRRHSSLDLAYAESLHEAGVRYQLIEKLTGVGMVALRWHLRKTR